MEMYLCADGPEQEAIAVVQIILKVRSLVTIIFASFVAGAKLGLAALDAAWNLTVEYILRLLHNFGY